MRVNQYVDVLIPRGGGGLIRAVGENSTIPVISIVLRILARKLIFLAAFMFILPVCLYIGSIDDLQIGLFLFRGNIAVHQIIIQQFNAVVAILIKRSRHDAVHLSFANELQVDRHVIDAVDQHIVAQTAVIDGLPADSADSAAKLIATLMSGCSWMTASHSLRARASSDFESLTLTISTPPGC